jgi:hypothetical protein
MLLQGSPGLDMEGIVNSLSSGLVSVGGGRFGECCGVRRHCICITSRHLHQPSTRTDAGGLVKLG